MKNYASFFAAVLVSVALLSSCYSAPEFDDTPSIAFEDLKFYDTSSQDSLVLTISFEDGDGNLGLRASETLPPYQQFFYFRADDGSAFIPNGSSEPGLPPLLTINDHDSLPAFNCTNYKRGFFRGQEFFEPFDAEPTDVVDTFYVQLNPYFNNIDVDYFVKRNDQFQLFDWRNAPSSGCGESFNGRFQPLFDDGGEGRPLSGTITYRMESFGFVPLFRNDTLKLQVRIRDRALNTSNVIESPEFTLSGIQVN